MVRVEVEVRISENFRSFVSEGWVRVRVRVEVEVRNF